MRMFRNALLGIALSASALGAVAPASAQNYRGYREYRHHNDDAAIAIGAGLVGLAVGAALASDGRDRYYDDGYYYYDRPRYRGGYYRHYDRPYYRDRQWRNDRRYYRGYRNCYTQRYRDDYRGRWVRSQRCR